MIRAGGIRKDPSQRKTGRRTGMIRNLTIGEPFIVTRYVEHGRVPIPKSARAEHIRENIDIFDFSLSQEEMQCIDGMETGIRAGTDPFIFNG